MPCLKSLISNEIQNYLFGCVQKALQKTIRYRKGSDKEKISFFVENPYHPSLRTKKIKGSDNIYEFSVNMDIRVIWFYHNDEVIILLDIGHHDILNKI